MKRTAFYISIHIIIPFIFAGIAVFSAIVALRIAETYMKHAMHSAWMIPLWIGILATIGFICGLIVVQVMVKPVERFVRKAEQSPLIAKASSEAAYKKPGDDMEHFAQVFEQVTDVLSRIEAKDLFPNIIGQSKVIRALLSQITKVAPTDTTVLISGESGTGKELVATSIHEHSLRKGKPFIKLNCVAVPEGLWESELFGHEKGSFTGATDTKKGKFEMANGGTLFLDEIGDMPLNTQAKILRVLQEREFERVGGTRPIKVNVRFIAATNKTLETMVKEGEFREDLFYRINVFSVNMPPLRERKEDIPLLVEHFLQAAPKPAKVASTALQVLLPHAWPGNVRELQNTLERAAVMCETGSIEPQHLPESITKGFTNQVMYPSRDSSSLDEQLREIEKGIIIEVLRKTGGVQVRAAEMLGIDQRSLWHRIKKYNIDITSFKSSTS